MLWLLLKYLFEEGCGLELIGVRLVSGEGSRIQRQGIEDGGLTVVWILTRKLFHGLFISQGAGTMVHGLGVLVECLDGAYVPLLTRCFRPVDLAFSTAVQPSLSAWGDGGQAKGLPRRLIATPQ